MESKRSFRYSDLEIKALIMKEDSGDKLYEVVDRLTGSTYSLKECNSRYGFTSRGSIYLTQINHEVEILKTLNHPNIVRCYEMFEIGDRVYLLLEHMDRGSLVAVDIKNKPALASVAQQVLSGLSFLHGNKISHGDVKPSNFFVNYKGEVKVRYLGKVLSKAVGVGEFHDEFSWDVWNVGLSILKLYKGSYWELRGSEFEEIMDSEGVFYYTPTPVQKPSVELWRFLICCMQTDLSKRWTAQDLVNHPFVKQQRSPLNMMLDTTQEALTGGEEEQMYPPKKKPRTFVEDKDSICSTGEERLNLIPETRPPDGIEYLIDDFGREDLTLSGLTWDAESSKGPSQTVPSGIHGTRQSLRKCIQHCSLFLPDCEFEKDKLVQLWIAEECIQEELTKRMEDVGSLYFNTLVHEELIIPSSFDNHYGQLKYKVNKSKSSTWFLKQGNYLRIDEGNLDEISGETLHSHLTWHCKKLDRTLSDALKKLKQLRTLIVLEERGALTKQLPNDIFLNLKLLRTLDLSCTHISELPGSIGAMESLRLLDVSETPIKRLPESTDRLYVLQTLKLRGCVGLFALPRGLKRLTDLRHLEFDIVGQLRSMPKGMGDLTKLQTLQAFLVGKNDGCGIGELKNMNDITGSFCISGLENVASAKEAKEAALADKRHIDKLELRWHDHGNDSFLDTAEILECLQPHFHLKELQIIHFSGSKLPSWISNPSFTDLASITLYKCRNCDILPCIGELPSLKVLHVVEMKNVRDIDNLFRRTNGTGGFNAFPKLEKLMLENMFNLEEWTGMQDGDFPCLRHVSIRYCPKLSILPPMSHLYSLQHLELSNCLQLISLPEELLPGSLETLIIRGCPKLNERCLKEGGEDWFKIAYVKNIWMDLQKVSID